MPTRPKHALVRVLTALTFLVTLASAQTGHPRLAPYTGVRQPGDALEVLVDGTWFELLSIDAVETDELLAFCEETWPGQALERVGEDLVEALTRMGHAPGDRVDLTLRDLASGEEVRRAGVPLTAANRAAVLARNRRERAPEAARDSVPRARREHAREVPDPYAALARIVEGASDSPSIPVTAALEDLDQLELVLEERFSYLTLRDVDHEAALDALRLGLVAHGDEVRVTTFAVALSKLLALFGDGHARAASLRSITRPGYTPFLVGDTSAGVAAFEPSRRRLVDPDHPYLVALDGVPLERWLVAAEPLEPQHSPQLRRRRALRNLRYLAHLRAELGREQASDVELTLASAAGERATRKVRLDARLAPVYGTWPRTESRRLAGDCGYLRVGSMDSGADFARELARTMQALADTRGLVIDVRGNVGGSRDAVRVLLPYFLAEGEQRVVNVAAPKLLPGRDAPEEGLLGDRYLYPLTWDGWSAPQRAAIEAFLAGFEPEWRPPEDAFGPWHVMLVEARGRPFAYEGAVVVLLDEDCFSATDIFLGAFAGLPNVTLKGTPSGGGSGRSRPARLAHSRLEVRLSSMASFRSDGRLYDGRGVEPDVLVRPAATDFVGTTDTVLDAALARLR